MTTLKDIAKRAEVAASTVSRILNYDPTLSVSDGTRRRVFQAAEKLNYTKPTRKRSANQRIRLGLVMWYSRARELQDIYYSSIHLGIDEAARQDKWEIVPFYQDNAWGPLAKLDAVIVVGGDQYTQKQLQRLQALKQPVVFVDSDQAERGFTSVTANFGGATRRIIDHFLAHGRQRIGMLTGNLHPTGDLTALDDFRYRDYRAYLTQQGRFNPDLVYVGRFDPESGYQVIKQQLGAQAPDQRPDALVVANDAMAVGALKALRELKMKIPQELGMISFNDTTIAQYATPALSSVRVDTHELGRKAVQMLANRLQNPQEPILTLTLQTKLILRGSSY